MLMDFGAHFLRLLPAEVAHRSTIRLIGTAASLLPSTPADDPRLSVHAFGHAFPNPIGLAAGFDKNAEVPAAMLRLGFGFVECGTVTPKPQSGNPRPRLFRLTEDCAVINRMGFNNNGVDAVAARLEQRPQRGIVGINIGANKDSSDRIGDFRTAFVRLAPLAGYVVVNVSSPNTPGLRDLQKRDELERLLESLANERAKQHIATPLLLKIAPDLEESDLDNIAHAALGVDLDGMIVTNTTIARPANLRDPNAGEAGGLSGAPLFQPSTDVLKAVRARVGDKLVLVGAGGVSCGADAYAKIRAGATLVQLYTALVFEGPGLVQRIKRDLLMLLARDGFANVTEAVGADVR